MFTIIRFRVWYPAQPLVVEQTGLEDPSAGIAGQLNAESKDCDFLLTSHLFVGAPAKLDSS